MKTISIVVIVVVIIIHILTGFFDFSSVTTEQIKSNYPVFLNKSVRLKQVSVVAWKSQPTEGGILLELDVLNGYGGFSRPAPSQNSLKTYAKVDEQSKLLQALAEGRFKFPEFQVKVAPDYVVLEKYQSDVAESWLEMPYYVSLSLLNTFVPLGISIVISMVLQIAVIIVIILLIVGGVIIAFPSVD